MSSNEAAVESALLEIAKDLLQASDDLAATDPSASAKLAHEAYEIGRDLGIVRSHLDVADDVDPSDDDALPLSRHEAEMPSLDAGEIKTNGSAAEFVSRRHDAEDEGEADLLRILDRQKAMLPSPVETVPMRKSGLSAKPAEFKPRQRRSGWLDWMRSREWHHAS